MSPTRGHSGFTLVEVVVALVVLEVCVVGVASMLALASRTLAEAERLEAAVATAEGVLDSLRLAPAPALADGSSAVDGGSVEWLASPDGAITVRVVATDGTALVVASARRLHR